MVHADGKVVDHPKPHAGPQRRPLGVFELFVADPLEPAVEPDAVRQPFPQRFCLRRAQGAGRVRPERVAGRQVLPDRRPQGEVVKALAGDPAELVKRGLPGRRPAGMVEQLEGLQLGGVHGVAVQPVALLVQSRHLLVEPLHRGALARLEVGHLGDGLNADVQRVEEAPGGRRIRRRLQGRNRLGSMQGIDQYVVRPAGTAEGSQVGQVGEVADAPRALGAHGVELGSQSPSAALFQRSCGGQPCGHHYQGGGRGGSFSFGVQGVPSQRQVLRQGEGGTSGRNAVDIPRLHPKILLDCFYRPGPAFQCDAQPGGSAVAHVDRNLRRFTLLDHDGGRQHPPPGRQFGFRQRRLDELVGVRLHSEGGEDLDQGVFGNTVRQAVPALEGRSHPMRIRQLLEEVRIHGLPGSSFTGSRWKTLRPCWRRRWWELLLV